MSKPQVRKIISTGTGNQFWAVMVDGMPPSIFPEWEHALLGAKYPNLAFPFEGEFVLVSEVSRMLSLNPVSEVSK